MATIFTRIIDGEIPGTFVWRDERCVAFLSANPMGRGHTLVVPIDEVDHWIDVSPELAAHLFEVTRIIALAEQKAFSPVRVGVIIAGFEVPHTHIHVIPTRDMGDMSFANAAQGVPREELEAAGDELRQALRSLGHGDRVPD